MKTLRVGCILLVLGLTGCTKAITAEYTPGIDLADNRLSRKTIAVHEFDDDRALIAPDHDKAKSFIAKKDLSKIGLKYNGEKLPPVSKVIQDVFVDELRSVGTNAVKGGAEGEGAYALDGRILKFGFRNNKGTVTVQSLRRVSLELTLTDPEGRAVFADQRFTSAQRQVEGLAITHEKNVEKLMSRRLKEVVQEVVETANGQLASRGLELMHVTLNGRSLNVPAAYPEGSPFVRSDGSGVHLTAVVLRGEDRP